MISDLRRATFTTCLAIGAALVVLASSARADRNEGKDRRGEGHSRWSHWRSRHEDGDRGRAHGAHRSGGSRELARGEDGHRRGERSYASREEGRGGRERAAARHRGGDQEHGRRGYHRYVSHARGRHERSGGESAHHGGHRGHALGYAHHRGGWHHRGEGPDPRRERRDRDGGRRSQRHRSRDY
jgi:hypothetical protein